MQQIQIHPPRTDGGPVIVTQGPPGVPQTAAEYHALLARREELGGQLNSAGERRNELAEQLRIADPAARTGIEARLKVLDDRIVRLESEIDLAGDQLANVPPALRAAETAQNPEFNLDEDIVVPVVGMLSVFVLLPLSIGLARLIWKRAAAPPAAISDHAMKRLEQIQQSIDTMAIEVERISEGQRFVTKIMSERALGAGAGEPLRALNRATIPSERG